MKSATRDAHGAVAPRDWESDAAWRERLARDARRADVNQTPAQRRVTEVLLARAHDLDAEAFALTGSTARSQRTAISDLDYHVIGPRPSRAGLADEVDIVATDAGRFWEKLRSGDDYVQWTLRFGCVLFDRTGVFREGMRVLSTERLWPDTARKHARLSSHRRQAQRLIDLGDRDAAQEQVRAALTSAARAVLLDVGVFPLSRTELPAQLDAIGRMRLALALRAVIDEVLSLPELAAQVEALDAVEQATIAISRSLPSRA
ncbi:MAG TPA: hypothetical protein VGO48_12675 [Conexibacter sp.]|jgi:hypothetical protein|nr:hypothetical protein [Conexibacter sp.]